MKGEISGITQIQMLARLQNNDIKILCKAGKKPSLQRIFVRAYITSNKKEFRKIAKRNLK